MIVTDFTHERMEIHCDRCALRGSNCKASFPPDLQLPDLLGEMTEDCPRQGPLQKLDRYRAFCP